MSGLTSDSASLRWSCWPAWPFRSKILKQYERGVQFSGWGGVTGGRALVQD